MHLPLALVMTEEKSGRGGRGTTISDGYRDPEESKYTMPRKAGMKATTLEPQELMSYTACWAATTSLMEKVYICHGGRGDTRLDIEGEW